MKRFAITYLNGKTDTIEADTCVQDESFIKFILGDETDGTVVSAVRQSVIKSAFAMPLGDGAAGPGSALSVPKP